MEISTANAIGQYYLGSAWSVSAEAYATSFTYQNVSLLYLNYTLTNGVFRVSGTNNSYVIETPTGEYIVRR